MLEKVGKVKCNWLLQNQTRRRDFSMNLADTTITIAGMPCPKDRFN